MSVVAAGPDGEGTYRVGDYLLDRLAELGVTDIRRARRLPAGVPRPRPPIPVRWVGGANELNAGYAADGYGRLRGMAALVTTFGVGELSAANAVAGSYAEHVPVVHIVGAPSKDAQGARRVVHHTLGDGDFEHFLRMSREITCAQANLVPATATREIDRVLSEVREQKRTGLPADRHRRRPLSGRAAQPRRCRATPAEPAHGR